MNKVIKKEIEKQLRAENPPTEWQRLILRYYDDIAGTDKAVILRSLYVLGWGYWRTLRELNRQGFYMSQTVFYMRRAEALADIAMRAAYERLICPYCMEKEQEEQETK